MVQTIRSSRAGGTVERNAAPEGGCAVTGRWAREMV